MGAATGAAPFPWARAGRGKGTIFELAEPRRIFASGKLAVRSRTGRCASGATPANYLSDTASAL